MKKKLMRTIALLLVLVTIASIVLGLTGCSSISIESIANDPETQILRSLEKTKASLQTGFSSSPLSMIVATLGNGATTITANGDIPTTNIFYANKEAGKWADTLEFGTGDTKQTYKLFASGTECAVSAPDILGEGIYGVNFKTWKNDLKDSPLLDVLGVSYEDVENVLNKIEEALKKDEENNSLGLLEMKKLYDDVMAVAKKCTVTVEEKSVITGNETVKGVNICYAMSAEQMCEIVDLIAKWYDTTAKDILGGICDSLGVASFDLETVDDDFIAADDGVTGDGFSWSGSYVHGSIDVSTMIEELKKELTESNANATLNITIDPKTEIIVKAEAAFTAVVDENNVRAAVTLDLGSNPATSSVHQLRFFVNDGSGTDKSVTVTYERMDSTGIYDRCFRIVSADSKKETLFKMRFTWRSADGDYSLTFGTGTEATKYKGMLGGDGNKLTMTIKGADKDSNVDLTLTCEYGVDVPAMPGYSNIFKLDAETWAIILGPSQDESDIDWDWN